ncbi:hypothetical protein C8A01DRAFT_16465 [Parachaetomium inaequale]|uniref:5'-3' DNA helicase ZGRF1-like N-terminal domain-containing protein n=1 Tax=Parachaetomium inaequale TaxID=2588326 RepID=A0AAN6SRQ0_9PEZI|nr:hypothetical protein C8A01DRAFT_16465 [Parachaetomium inaequale]
MPSMIPSRPASTGASDPSGGGRSAPVLEFICLFTHDLRRKQKRWEDGRLKYHTFNKRVMVYDERGHSVGDMHWQREEEFGEGEEVQLERGGVIVQVMECVGRQEQDLSELLDKRVKEREQRQAWVAMRSSAAAASPNTPVTGTRPQDHFQTRHRPLNHLLGTPTGHHGRAVVPIESPFELRQKANDSPNDHTDSRPPKRRKRETTPPSKMGYAQSLFGATLSLSAVPVSSAPPRGPVYLTYRQQSEPSSPQEEVRQNVARVREDRNLSGRTGLHASSSRANNGAPPSRTPLEANRGVVHEDQESLETTSTALGRPCPGNAIPGRRMSVPQPENSGNRPSISLSNGKPPAAAVRPALNPSRPEREATTPFPKRTPVINQVEAVSNAQTTDVPELGVSRSQAIVLDEDPGPDPGVGHEVFERQKEANSAAPQRGALNRAKKPPKRKKSAQAALEPLVVESRTTAKQPEHAEGPPWEERTELRLKPRQKRGLLLLSEKRNRPKKPKGQGTLPDEPSPIGRSSEQDTTRPAAEPNLADGLGTAGAFSSIRQDNPFASSPVAPRNLTPEPELRSLQSNGHQDAWRGDEAEVENMHATTRTAGTASREHTTKLADVRESPKPADNNINMGDETILPPSPRGRGGGSRSKRSAQAEKETSEPPSLGLEEPSEDLDPEHAMSRPSRQTRKTKDLDDEASTRPKKKARRANSDDSAGEELPQAPPRPRLARLSKKSVRSREVFGFVPSSPPVGNLANTVQPVLSAGVVNEAQLPVGEPQSALPSATLSEATPSALRRRNSLSVARTGGRVIEESTVEQPATSTTLQSDPPMRRTLVRDAATLSSSGSGKDKDTAAKVSLPGPETIAAPEKETAPTTTRSSSANQKGAPAVDSTALPSQLPGDLLSLPEQPRQPMNDAPDIETDSGVTDGPNKHVPDASAAGPTRPRIVNPATRGRKAALKSDAAGQVPQPVVPVEPVPAARVGMRQPAVVSRPDPAASERPKRTMRFPGFASAKGGGPWSREAHDLLESARPS